MSDKDQYQRELDVIDEVKDKSPVGKFFGYARISGPGWLQGAITLGGGSLAGALYLGVVSGYDLLWVQPLAMICGIIMLSAIAYVTLSTGERPLGAINKHLNPLLGWSWVVATVMANIVWVMPQFALGTAAVQQNLFSGMEVNKWLIISVLFAIGMFVNYLYESGGGGAKLFDKIIKVMVAIIVLSFMAVVVSLASSGQLPWGEIFSGYLPNFSLVNSPSATFSSLIENSSDSTWWDKKIIASQKSVIFAAFGTAVGINMTFLLPYTLLKKKWGPKHRGLSITDLSIGLFVPFFLATSCVVIAAASSFHGKTDDLEAGATDGFLAGVPIVQQAIQDIPAENEAARAVATQAAIAALPEADRQLAGMLHKRDAKSLAVTLAPFTGNVVAQKIFGIGVLGMAVSTIIILMLINGLAFQELFAGRGTANAAKALSNKTPYFIGCTVSGLAGFAFPKLWTGKSLAALAVPTSVIGGSMLPIAYFTFLLLMNSKKVLGDKRPEGRARIIWNVLMIFSTTMATVGSYWATAHKKFGDFEAGKWGMGFLALLFVVGTVSFVIKEKKA